MGGVPVSRGPVLALLVGPAGKGTEALEFLRLVAGLVAHGETLRLAILGGAGWAADDERHDEIDRHLEALRAFDVVPTPLAESDLSAAIAAASSVICHPDPTRSGEPPVLEATPTTPTAQLEAAGQVIPHQPPPPSPADDRPPGR